MNKFLLFILICLMALTSEAQQTDSLPVRKNAKTEEPRYAIKGTLTNINERRQKIKSLIIPSAMITYGFITLGNDGLQKMNLRIKENIWNNHPHKPSHIDNFLQFIPALSVYGLNAIGIKGKNNFRDRSMIYVLSNVILNATVFPLKRITHQLRPDSSGYTSFPSGHTAEAFASAEFLRMEYKDVSPWYAVAGYAMAASTGYLRMYNNKHWLGDIVAGAGIGIASARIAYWLYPKIKKWLFKEKQSNTACMPFFQNKVAGLSLVHNF